MHTNCGYSRVARRKLSCFLLSRRGDVLVAEIAMRMESVRRIVGCVDHPRGNARSVYRNNSDLKTSQRAATARNARAVEEA